MADNSALIKALKDAIDALDSAEANAANAIAQYNAQRAALKKQCDDGVAQLQAQCKAGNDAIDASIKQVNDQAAQAESQEAALRAAVIALGGSF